MKQHVAVVIPNWNGKELLGDCLRSLEKQTIRAEIILVDNGSRDGSVDYVRRHFPKVTVIELDKNYGFAGGVNRGINHAIQNGAAYVALFNNDAVASVPWLAQLCAVLERQPHAGMVTGKFMRMDKKHLDSTGEFLRKNGMPYSRGRDEIDRGQYDQPKKIFAATGGATLYRVKMLQETGLFDEDFFAYLEDVDLSFRAQMLGWHVMYQPTAISYHHIGKTSSKLGSFRRYHSVKNFILLYNKNMPGWLYWKYKPRFLTRLVLMGFGALRSHEFGAYLRAFGRSVLLIPSTLMKRRRIQRQRRVDSSYFANFIGKGTV